MNCEYIEDVMQYLIIGMVYASVKHYALWEYYKDRCFWTKLHHYWFEACFWPIDFLYHTVKLLRHKTDD